MKKLKKILKILFFIWVLFASIVGVIKIYDIFFEYDYDDYKDDVNRLPIWNWLYYGKWYEKSFLERFQACTNKELLTYVDAENKIGEYFIQPAKPGKGNKDTLNKFKSLYKKWPPFLREFAENHILGVYFVKELGTTGLTDCVWYNDLFIIFINEKVFQLKPNEWASYMENTLLDKVDPNNKIKRIIEIKRFNNVERTLESILIHELGHTLGVFLNSTPNWNGEIYKDYNNYTFFQDVYYINYVKMKLIDDKYKSFNKLKYYSIKTKKKITIDNYIDCLNLLEKSGFPTLYSTINELDYFADSFYSYVHCILQKRPYEYQAVKDGKIVKTSKNGILSPRSKKIKDYFINLDKSKCFYDYLGMFKELAKKEKGKPGK